MAGAELHLTCASTPCDAACTALLVQAFADRPYKWLLYGDDDTLWFVDGVLDLVKDLDPGMPYFISGGHTLHVA